MTTDILFHSNEEALFTGINLVKQIFTRFARLQTNTPPEPEDELLNGLRRDARPLASSGTLAFSPPRSSVSHGNAKDPII